MLLWRAVIESKLALFDKQVEVLFGDAIVFSQGSLCLIPEVFDAVDVVESMLGKMRTVIDAMVVES